MDVGVSVVPPRRESTCLGGAPQHRHPTAVLRWRSSVVLSQASAASSSCCWSVSPRWLSNYARLAVAVSSSRLGRGGVFKVQTSRAGGSQSLGIMLWFCSSLVPWKQRLLQEERASLDALGECQSLGFGDQRCSRGILCLGCREASRPPWLKPPDVQAVV